MSIEQLSSGTVFLNEGWNEYVRHFAEHNDTGVDIELLELPLESAVIKFLEGNYSAWVTGLEATTGDVARVCKDVIGLDKDGLLSSFFSMEMSGQEPFFLGDCALLQKPENLIKVANKTVESLKDMKITPKVAFLASPGAPDPKKGDAIRETATQFAEMNEGIESMGVVTWKQARELGANTFFFDDLNAGNICYKIENDPDGGDWIPGHSADPYVNVLTKDGRERYSSNYPMHTPTAEELVEFTVRAYNMAMQSMTDGRLPRVVLLSYATLDSAISKKTGQQPEDVAKIEEAIKIIQENYPEMQIVTEGPLQWDSATDERVYKKKTKKEFHGEPDVFIFPTRDAGNIAYEMLQETGGGNRTAVGPIFQGLKDGKKVIDLSRGAREREIEGAVKTGGRSDIALKVVAGRRLKQPDEEELAA